MDLELKKENSAVFVQKVLEKIKDGVESQNNPLSSESSFRFLFAWELGRLLNFSPQYRFDFEWRAYSDLGTDDNFLDLLLYTNPSFKIALEFKLPKSSQSSKTNSTQTRGKICRDISRLSYLVRNKINSISLGYFLCATDEGTYLSQGRKISNPQYETYHEKTYRPNEIIPKGQGSNGIPRDLQFPNHEVRFSWQEIAVKKSAQNGYLPKGRFAWLTPIEIWA